MTILYGLISRGKTVLAEFTNASGNFQTVTRVLLGKISENQDGKMSYVYDNHVFHYIVENRITYLCMCDETEKRRIPFAFLADMKQLFNEQYGEQAHTAIAFAFNAEFSPILMQRMNNYNNNDPFTAINNKIHDVKDVMVQNVENLLERGEKLTLLVDKTEQLHQTAFKFERTSRHLKTTMFWRKIKLYSGIFIFFTVAIWLISSSVCGFDYSKCST
mmetsp:Transcript_2908/g.3044  ORF Transcript_2908/g.3044 Transcript_2908/m.3044 type:complete len:217 (-) Transcript_2908:92-742(-)